MKLGLIGYGSLATQALSALADYLSAPLEACVCLARDEGAERAKVALDHGGARLARTREVAFSMEEFLAHRPDLVAEAAGHGALSEVGVQVLRAGADLIVTSVGALAHPDLKRSLDAAALRGGSRLIVCAGAVGGLDLLAAAKLSGLSKVVYTSRKPPLAWTGTKAESLVDLRNLSEARTFFTGDAGRAAREYPQNANVAATIALGGAGFEDTRVELVADPGVSRNVHEVSVTSKCANFSFRIEGNPSPDNPKTSMTAGYALAHSVIDALRL